MLTQQGFQVRTAAPAEDALIAQHFYQMWLDNQVPEAAIAPDWHETVLQYIDLFMSGICRRKCHAVEFLECAGA